MQHHCWSAARAWRSVRIRAAWLSRAYHSTYFIISLRRLFEAPRSRALMTSWSSWTTYASMSSSFSINPLLAAPFFDFRFCTFRTVARVYLIERGQLFYHTIAWPCQRAGIGSQPISHARCGVRASEAKCAKNRIFKSNNGIEGADAKQSMVVQRYYGATC